MYTIDSVADVDNIILAYKRLQTAPGGFYKNFYLKECYSFGLDLDKHVAEISHHIKESIYNPDPPQRFYMPKQNGLVRPITVLSFHDLVVYQALTNILALAFYEELNPYYNKYVFGNVLNSDDNGLSIFFYLQWKQQLKKYDKYTIQYYNSGLKYISEFDIASFYDTVDHHLLSAFIISQGVDIAVIELLQRMLLVWTFDPERNTHAIKHGIPQGPISSGFLAEIYLHYIDSNMLSYSRREGVRYMRYVDDIKLFTSNLTSAHRSLAYLDLLARDIGLIPQPTKIRTEAVANIHEVLSDSKIISGFSQTHMTTQTLPAKQEKKIVKALVRALEDEIKNKTIIRFAMYRISENDAVKKLLLSNSVALIHIFDDICYYLSRHFLNDEDTKRWIQSELEKEHTYKYIIALLFKHFYKSIPFSYELYNKYFGKTDERHWLIEYYMLDWLAAHKPELIYNIVSVNSALTKQKLYATKFTLSTTDEAKFMLLEQMKASDVKGLKLESIRLAHVYLLQADPFEIPHHIWRNLMEHYTIPEIGNHNYVSTQLERDGVRNASSFFNNVYWGQDQINALKDHLMLADKSINVAPAHWLVSINNFNHIVTTKLLDIGNVEYRNPKEYSNILDINNYIKEVFPQTHQSFHKILNARNEKGGHPYTDTGQLSKSLRHYELPPLQNAQRKALNEIVETVPAILTAPVAASKEPGY